MAPRSHIKPDISNDRPAAQRSASDRSAIGRRPRFPVASPYAAPLVAVCSVALSACMAFGNPLLWEGAAQHAGEPTPEPAAEQAPEPEAPAAPEEPEAPEQEVIGEYQAISQSEDAGRGENIRLATEAINGTVIEPGGGAPSPSMRPWGTPRPSAATRRRRSSATARWPRATAAACARCRRPSILPL